LEYWSVGKNQAIAPVLQYSTVLVIANA
jgi:hypothetical protein